MTVRVDRLTHKETEAEMLLHLDEAQVRAKLSVERARVHSQIYQVLTPEQRSKMETIRKDFREGKGRGMHRQKTDKSTPAEKQ